MTGMTTGTLALRLLAATLAAILLLSSWLHTNAAQGNILPVDIQLLIDGGDRGLVIPPRELDGLGARADISPPAGGDGAEHATILRAWPILVRAANAGPRPIAADSASPTCPCADPTGPRGPPVPLPI
jgi:hypothetical protein